MTDVRAHIAECRFLVSFPGGFFDAASDRQVKLTGAPKGIKSVIIYPTNAFLYDDYFRYIIASQLQRYYRLLYYSIDKLKYVSHYILLQNL